MIVNTSKQQCSQAKQNTFDQIYLSGVTSENYLGRHEIIKLLTQINEPSYSTPLAINHVSVHLDIKN